MPFPYEPQLGRLAVALGRHEADPRLVALSKMHRCRGLEQTIDSSYETECFVMVSRCESFCEVWALTDLLPDPRHGQARDARPARLPGGADGTH